MGIGTTVGLIGAQGTKTQKELDTVKNAINSRSETKTSDAEGVDLDITDPSGNVLMRLQGGHVKTKNFDSSEIGGTEETTADADLDIVDENNNVLARLSDGELQTKYFDSRSLKGILYRNQDSIDGVYAACRWHQPNSSSKQFCILVGGDIHGDTVRMNSMIDYLNAVDAFDAGIMVGDIGGVIRRDDSWYTKAIARANKPFLTVIGNHDTGTNSSAPADQTQTMYTFISELYNKYMAPNLQYAELESGEHDEGACYYFKDFDSYDIRMIVLNQYEYPPDYVESGQSKTFVYTRGQMCFSQKQIDWFCDTLNDTPSDFGVIVVLHVHPGWMDKDFDNILTASTASGTAGAPPSLMATTNGYIIEEIIHAWVNGTTLQQTFAYTVSGSYGASVSVDADFTERGTGEFITYICGHWHMSIVEKTHNHGQASYTVAAAGLSAATQGDTPRREGTKSEDNFVALAVDRDKKTVKVFQIGAHFSKDGKDRIYGQYSYEIV